MVSANLDKYIDMKSQFSRNAPYCLEKQAGESLQKNGLQLDSISAFHGENEFVILATRLGSCLIFEKESKVIWGQPQFLSMPPEQTEVVITALWKHKSVSYAGTDQG